MNKSVEQYEINHGVHNWINYRTEIYTDGDIIVDENRSKELTNAVYSNSLGNLYATKEVGIIKNATYAYLLEGHNRYPQNKTQEWSFSIIDMKTEEIVFQMNEKSNPEMDYGEALQVAYDKLEDMINTDRDKESGENFTEDIDNSDLGDFDPAEQEEYMSNTYEELVDYAEIIVNIVNGRYKEGNKLAYLPLLSGVGTCKVESFPGTGHNYQAIIDAIHNCYKRTQDEYIKEGYQDGLDGMKRMAVNEMMRQSLERILLYEKKLEETGAAGFCIEM